MRELRQATREISYAHSAETRAGRALIRTVENLTGRLALIHRARGYEREIAAGADFWEVMVARYGLELEVVGGALANIPATGPVIVLSNHPFGILDGLMMGHLLSQARGDFRVLAHKVFRKAQELDRVVLPVSFEDTKEALALNLETRQTALAYLAAGGCIGIFPGGTVSTALTPFGVPMDPGWRTFTAKMIAKSRATVVPVFFEGANSRLFQVASHLHVTLRMALLINEFRRRTGAPVRIVVGEPIPQERLAAYRSDPRAMMAFLRAETYRLSPVPFADLGPGYEFEAHHRRSTAGTG